MLYFTGITTKIPIFRRTLEMKKLDFVRMRIEFKMKGRFQSFLSSFLSKTTWIFLKIVL